MDSSTTTSGTSASPAEAGSVRAELDGLWSRYRSRWRRLLRRPVSELALRASFDVSEVSLRQYANRVPAGTVPDCPQCQHLCCAGLDNLVSLRLVDVATLLDVGRPELMSRSKPRFPPSWMQRKPALFELAGSELFRTLPVLRQLGPERRCAALTDDDRCSLHPHWPVSCDRFPYSMLRDRRVVWGSRCPSKQQAPRFAARGQQMFARAIDVYNERIRDAVLLHHARRELDAIGIGAYLTRPGEDPFEPTSSLPLY